MSRCRGECCSRVRDWRFGRLLGSCCKAGRRSHVVSAGSLGSAGAGGGTPLDVVFFWSWVPGAGKDLSWKERKLP